jgi:N-acetylneuraminic acid mutarotase
MVHVQNYILIFGGRIDVTQTSTYTCFNDVHMLCLQRLLWVRVKVLGEVPTARSGHCASVLGSGMYIFGGVSNTCYCSSDMYVLETNRQSVFNYLKKDEKKKQFLLDVESYKAKRGKKSKSLISKSSSKAFSRVSATPSKELIYNL